VLEHRSDDQTLRDGDTVIDALHEPRTSISLPLGGFRTLTEFLNIPDRVLPWHLSWMIIDSACEAMVEGEVYRLGPGTVFWLPAGTRNRMHAIRGVPPVTLYHMRIDMSPSPRAGPAGR